MEIPQEILELLEDRKNLVVRMKALQSRIDVLDFELLQLAFCVHDVVQDSILPRRYEYLGPITKANGAVYAAIRPVGTKYKPREIPVPQFLKNYVKTHTPVR